MAFVALVPLMVALAGWQGRPGRCPGVRPRRGFLLGLLTGMVHFAGTVYWTGATVQQFGGLASPVAVLVAGLLVSYMSLYVAGAAAVTAALVRRLGLEGLWLAPCAWVGFEYLRGHLFGGFPWIPLGNAAVSVLPLAQWASVGGVYGLSLLIGLCNVGIVAAAVATGRVRVLAIGSTAAMLAGVSLWGAWRIWEGALVREGTAVTVGLVQGNIAQRDKWNPSRASMILDRYLAMTRQAVADGAELVVWPETATPFFFDEDPSGQAQVRNVVRDVGRPLLFGTDEVERASPARYFNSAFMLDAAGATKAVYRKIHLVPFGEYVPFQEALFFVAPLVEAVSAFSPGERVTMMPVNGHQVSTAICYEVTYPDLIREGVLTGAELLTTITNDAWYGSSSAPFQHFEMATMRAIEQGRYLVRAANTGVTGIVDPYGRVLARTNLFETTTVLGEVRFLQARTLYARMGDWPAWASIALIAMALVMAVREGRFRAAAPPR